MLLPVVLGYKETDIFAGYQQRHLVAAFSEFLARVPDGDEAYRRAVRRFASTLYSAASAPGSALFVDKTPRYHLIASELLDCFPDSRFLILWRNPLAVASSCISHWGGGRFNLHHYRIDLYLGVASLLEVQRRDDPRVFGLRYEDLVREPEHLTQRVFDHLGLPRTDTAVGNLAGSILPGTMGDMKGMTFPGEVTTAGIEQWKGVLGTPLRRAWARRYLRWLGRDRLLEMGYSFNDLSEELSRARAERSRFLSDAARLLYGWWAIRYEFALFGRKRALARARGGMEIPCE
jgi:hypothetical protein